MIRRAVMVAMLVAGCGDGQQGSPDAGASTDTPPASTDPIDVTLQFTPKVGSEPFACGQTYTAMGAETTAITPRDFRIYVSDVQLVGDDGSHVPLALTQDQTWQLDNLALLDFEDFTGGCADGTPETNRTIRGTAPAGHYTGVAFTIGVPEAMNHVDLTTQPAPLNFTSLWWGWGFGHIFMAVVTHADITEPAPATNDHYIHVGSIDCTGDPEAGETVTCARPNRPYIELTGFDPTTTVITADFGAVIAHSSLATSVGCHSFSEDTCAFPFDAVGLNWFTGSQTPTTQKLFRIDP